MGMEGKEILLGIVDLAIALIGFSSIVTALRRSKVKPWSAQEINGLVFLAIMAIASILFALLPFPLFHMGWTEGGIYSTAATVYVVFSVAVNVGMFVRGRRAGFPSRRPRIFNAFAVLSLGIIAMMFLVASGRITEGLLGYYLFGVIWLLVLAFVQFVVFLSFVGIIEDESVEVGESLTENSD
jgi:hypothetical protein